MKMRLIIYFVLSYLFFTYLFLPSLPTKDNKKYGPANHIKIDIDDYMISQSYSGEQAVNVRKFLLSRAREISEESKSRFQKAKAFHLWVLKPVKHRDSEVTCIVSFENENSSYVVSFVFHNDVDIPLFPTQR